MPLKHLSNFLRKLEMPLINGEINLIFTSSKNCVLASKATRDANPDENPVVAAIDNPTNTTFKITDTKFYVPVVILSTENHERLLRTGLSSTIKNRI